MTTTGEVREPAEGAVSPTPYPGVVVDWRIPATPPGAAGGLERFMGPGKTRAESLVEFGGVGVCAALLAVGVGTTDLARGWSWVQLVVLALVGLDLLGGIVTNATNAAKRWYHRRSPGARRARLAFVAAHVLHLVVFGLVILGGDPAWILGNTALLVIGALLVEYAPLPVRRPVAMAVYAAAVLVGLFWLTVPAALAWFGPLFHLKLLVCHLIPEAPLAEAPLAEVPRGGGGAGGGGDG
ncbi:hypothetical protein [Streptomyces sp. NPDC047981]|uniref:hypothetical protein n=1 Tax=Streptomyces sp. NPDC047981 TaxID=3154610 RepID=UPI003418F271